MPKALVESLLQDSCQALTTLKNCKTANAIASRESLCGKREILPINAETIAFSLAPVYYQFRKDAGEKLSESSTAMIRGRFQVDVSCIRIGINCDAPIHALHVIAAVGSAAIASTD